MLTHELAAEKRSLRTRHGAAPHTRTHSPHNTGDSDGQVWSQTNGAFRLQRFRPGLLLSPKIRAHVLQAVREGKKFRTINPVYRKIYLYRLCTRNEFRRNFEFFVFKIQKFKKIIKNENRISLLSGRISMLSGRKTLF